MKKNKIFLIVLLATTLLSTNAMAETNCPEGTTLGTSCWKCGDNCTAYLSNDPHEGGNKQLNITGTGPISEHGGWSRYTYAAYGPGIITSVNIEQGITSIGNSAFSYNTSVERVTIPDSVTSIGEHAFAYSPNIREINLPESLTSIAYNAFLYVKPGPSLVVPNSVESIGSSAFTQMSELKSLFIPESVTSFGGTSTSGLSDIQAIFCFEGHRYRCQDQFYSYRDKIIVYTKDENGIYKVGDTYYASPEDMSHIGEGGNLSPIACTDYERCQAAAAAYKDAKAESMAGGSLCATKNECLNLIDMTYDDEYACTTIARCSEYAKTNNIQLAGLYGRGENNGGSGNTNHVKHRIYTVEEAARLSKPTGNTFKIRYK